MPPYVIFHDTTLRAMAMARPRTSTTWKSIPGIGQAKLDRYGAAFLAVLAGQVGSLLPVPSLSKEPAPR